MLYTLTAQSRNMSDMTDRASGMIDTSSYLLLDVYILKCTKLEWNSTRVAAHAEQLYELCVRLTQGVLPVARSRTHPYDRLEYFWRSPAKVMWPTFLHRKLFKAMLISMICA